MVKKIFITGASGFIGANLAKKLNELGYELSLLLHKTSKHPFIENLTNTKKFSGDITDKQSVKTAMVNCDTVFHCAAKISFSKYCYGELYKVNVEGTRNVLESALELGVKKFIHISACAVLGYSKNKDIILDENSDPEISKENSYAYTKKAAEEEVRNFCQKGLNAVIANLSTVYGEGDIHLNSGSIIKTIYSKKLKFAPAGGTSVVSIKDIINGLILLMEKGKKGERYILANENLEYLKLCNIIAKTLGVNEIKFKLPNVLYYPSLALINILHPFLKKNLLFSPQIVKESFRYKYFNNSKAQKELGWTPQVEFKNAVTNALEFYKKTGLMQ